MRMWTNLTAWQTLTSLADGPGSEQRSYSSTYWTLTFSTVLTFLSLVVQNYIDYSTAIGEEPNTRGRRGALSSYHKTRIISPIPQLKGLDTQHNTTQHWPLKGGEFTAMCILLKTKIQECNSSVQNATWVCVLLHVLFWGVSYRTAFLSTNWHWTGNVEDIDTSKFCLCYYWTDIFNTFFLIK